MSEPIPQVDQFLRRVPHWREEITELRGVLLAAGLTETLKWAKPCYTFGDANVVIVQPFKHYLALMFCQGALLKDSHRLLVAPGQHTQAGRQLRFTSLEEVRKRSRVVRAYVREAVAAAKAGRSVAFKTEPEPRPEELMCALADDPPLRRAFEALTPGRQRGYILHIAAAKQSATRAARIAKHRKAILAGDGLHDGYKKTRDRSTSGQL